MSVFQVNLGEDVQGDLDRHFTPGSGATPDTTPPEVSPSLQRQVYVMGPNKINRLLSDGEQFTDCNYWKRFAPYNATSNPGGCLASEAFVEIITDDGSVWSDVDAENTYPIGQNAFTGADGTLGGGETETLDVQGELNSYAVSATVKNTGGANDMTVTVNGVASAVMTVDPGDTLVFGAGDMQITSLAIFSTTGTTYEALLSVKSQCAS